MNQTTPLLNGDNEFSISIKKMNEENIENKISIMLLSTIGIIFIIKGMKRE